MAVDEHRLLLFARCACGVLSPPEQGMLPLYRGARSPALMDRPSALPE
jgi:hypothetical protein